MKFRKISHEKLQIQCMMQQLCMNFLKKLKFEKEEKLRTSRQRDVPKSFNVQSVVEQQGWTPDPLRRHRCQFFSAEEYLAPIELLCSQTVYCLRETTATDPSVSQDNCHSLRRRPPRYTVTASEPVHGPSPPRAQIIAIRPGVRQS
jgi:hypothetical protein